MTRLGRPRLHLRETSSTNDRARELAAAGAPHGALVTAGSQIAGRGRQGRTWSAPPGQALLLSLIVRKSGETFALLPLAAGVSVAEIAGPQARIKWPNDILIDDRKVSGILCEGRPQEGWAIVGIGVNVAVGLEDLPAELRTTAATLGRPPSALEEVLGALLAALERALALTPAELLAAWSARDGLRGRTIHWTGGSGIAGGIDGVGRLVVELPGGGRTALDAGEVHLGHSPQDG